MTSKWGLLVQRCFQQRISPAKFQAFAEVLQKDEPIDGVQLSLNILARVEPLGTSIDPLVVTYLETLLTKALVKPHDVLQAMLDSRGRRRSSEDQDAFSDMSIRLTVDSALDQSILMYLARGFSSDTFDQQSWDYQKLFETLARWMNLIVTQAEDMVVSTAAASSQEVMTAVMVSREAFATMLVLCLLNEHVSERVKSDAKREEPKQLAEAFVPFMPVMAQTNLQWAGRLQMIQKDYEALQLDEAAKLRHIEDGAQNVGHMRLESIIDAEPINTRASFMVHLDGLLDGRPNADESHIFGYVQTRYKGDLSTAIVDFVTACFDVLALCVSRGDSTESMFVPRSFVANKAPSIISLLATTGFVTISNDMLISQALSRFDPSLFAPFSQNDFLGNQANSLADTRQQFLLACVVQNIIAFDSVSRILGEQPSMSLPDEGRLSRQQLVDGCRGNTQKLDQLVEKTEAFDGNAVTRVEAVAQIFQSTCESRDKVALKTLCNQISRRPSSMDALMLYSDFRTLSHQLSALLTDWRHDDDEGEHQPVYDEFAACVLLLLALSYRFRLSPSELGFSSEHTFWQLLLQGNLAAKPINTLDEDQNRRLSGWIGGLFESNSLGDEVLSSCSPQDFYVLAPTLFQQTIMACKLGALEASHLKNGLELLLYSFLMPALIPTFLWLINNAQEHSDEDNIFVSILEIIVRPPSPLNGDAPGMHKTMLSILGDPLIGFLRDLMRRQAGRKHVESLTDALQKHAGFARAVKASSNLFRTWISNNPEGIVGNLRTVIGSLCFWTNAPVQTPMPGFSPSLVRAAVELKGAKTALYGIVDEINGQIATGMGDAALDIGTAIIASSSVADSGATPDQLTLREALQLELSNAVNVFADKAADHLRVETCVRLSRRVETLLANINANSSEHQHQQAMQMPMGDTMMGDIGLDAATAAAVGLGTDDAVGQAADGQGADALNFGGASSGDLGMDLDAALANPQQQQGQNVGDQGGMGEAPMPLGEDDIFGDLDVDDFNF